MKFLPEFLQRKRIVRILLTISVVACLLACFGGPWLAIAPNFMARRAISQRAPEQAIDWVRWSERLAGPTPESELLLARANRKLARWDAVHEHLTRARALGASEVRTQREDWLARAQSGQLQEVEHRRNQMLLDPQGDTHEICEAYVRGYLVNRRFQEAVQLLESWSADYPENPQPHYLLGITYAERSKATLAVKSLQRAVELDPDRFQARLALANALLENKQAKEALAEFQNCREIRHEDAEVAVGIAKSILALGTPEGARVELEKGLTLFPDDFNLRLELGRLLMHEDFSSALVHLEKAVALEPRSIEARYVLAQILSGLGRKEEAEGHLEYVESANEQLAVMQKHTDAVHSNAADVDARYQIGITELKYGTEQDGIQWLQSVLNYDPGHKETNAALASYYEARQSESTAFAELASRYRKLAMRESD